MKKQFQKVAIPSPDRSVFDLSHEHTTSLKLGKVVPVLCKEMIPFEKIRLKPEMFAQFQPLVSPVKHRLDLKYEVFFVPNDIIWDNWKKFINGEKVNGLDVNHPKFTGTHADWDNIAGNYLCKGSLADYLGIPVTQFGVTENEFPNFSQLPFRAYQLIWNNYYRNQNLQDEVAVGKDDNDRVYDETETLDLLTLRSRNWEKDYYTSALPWAQKGDPVNLAEEVNIEGTPIFKTDNNASFSADTVKASTITPPSKEHGLYVDDTIPTSLTGLELENSSVTITVRDFRWAMALQKYLERMMLVGSRYFERILALFGRFPSHARSDIPEFLGGGSLPVMVSENQSSVVSGAVPQGHLTGRAVSAGVPDFCEYEAQEYGWLIAVVSVMPRTKYHQGMHKQFWRFDQHDYLNPMFANIGEQELLLKEVYVNTGTNNDETFGYQERFGEYKSLNDRVSGELHLALRNWTMLRTWDQYPSLNDEFLAVQDDETMWEVFAVTDKDPVILQIWFNFTSVLPLPSLSIPK